MSRVRIPLPAQNVKPPEILWRLLLLCCTIQNISQEAHYDFGSYYSSPFCKWIERSILTKECYAVLAWSTIQLYRRQQDIIKERVSRDPAPMSSRPAPQNSTDSLQIPIMDSSMFSSSRALAVTTRALLANGRTIDYNPSPRVRGFHPN